MAGLLGEQGDLEGPGRRRSACPICDVPDQLSGASWGDDGTIVFAARTARTLLWRVPRDRRTPTVLTSPTADVRMYYFPHVLPGSKAAFVMLLTKDPKTIGLVSLETGAILHTLFAGSTPRFVQGFLVFRRFETLHAAPFDLKGLRVTGESQRVLEGVSFKSGSLETSAFDVSTTGALVFTPPLPRVAEAELVWLDGQGHIKPVVADARDYRLPSLDPDGRRVAVHVASAGDRDLWRCRPSGRTTSPPGRGTPLTRGQMTSDQIVWSSDGRWIVFTSQKLRGTPTLFRIRADGGEPQQLSRDAEYGSYQKAHDFPNSVHGNVLMFSRQVRLPTTMTS